jgi:hypothetical protein
MAKSNRKRGSVLVGRPSGLEFIEPPRLAGNYGAQFAMSPRNC